jgi:hypothetical protein
MTVNLQIIAYLISYFMMIALAYKNKYDYEKE